MRTRTGYTSTAVEAEGSRTQNSLQTHSEGVVQTPEQSRIMYWQSYVTLWWMHYQNSDRINQKRFNKKHLSLPLPGSTDGCMDSMTGS